MNVFRHPIFLSLATLSLLFASTFAPAAPASKAKAKPTSASQTKSPVFSNAYESPRNKVRPKRTQTQFIILHTTEGARKGSLVKLRDNGECHYVVDETGIIYRIVDRRKIAAHCGRSMWNGITELDRFSIGIEIVGRHDRELTPAQYVSLKYLLADLKHIYSIPDDKILTHSMVAYDTPNHWHKKNHRGRKRCAMLLANPARRLKMGLHSKPSYDPDLKAKRLADADPELTRILYGSSPTSSSPTPKAQTSTNVTTPKPNPSLVIGPGQGAWDIARERYNSTSTLYHFPNGSIKKGSEIRDWKSLPSGTIVSLTPSSSSKSIPTPSQTPPKNNNVIGPKQSAWDIARDLYNAPTTLYQFPDGSTRKGSDIRDWKAIPSGTIVTVSNEEDNATTSVEIVGRTSSSIRDLVGDEALAPSTFYIEPGKNSYRRGSSMTLQQVQNLPGGTRILVQYNVGGPISAKKRAFDICGTSWKRPETYYLSPRGELIPGNAIGEKSIPMGAWVFYRK